MEQEYDPLSALPNRLKEIHSNLYAVADLGLKPNWYLDNNLYSCR